MGTAGARRLAGRPGPTLTPKIRARGVPSPGAATLCRTDNPGWWCAAAGRGRMGLSCEFGERDGSRAGVNQSQGLINQSEHKATWWPRTGRKAPWGCDSDFLAGRNK